MKMLVVDDDFQIRELFQEILRDAGHEVTTAGSGEEALVRLGEQEFDILLTDRAMPGMKGEELAQQAKRLKLRLRVILITGDPDKRVVRAAALEAGVDLVLYKPIDPEQLVEAVRQVGLDPATIQ